MRVNPTTHPIEVLPAKAGPKVEPVSALLAATLVHPERKASIGQVHYSADGKKLFLAGYPSGIVQVYDVESKKELRRLETPKGFRSSMEYAFPNGDWKTLYVSDERARKVVPVETEGKKDYRIEQTGHVLVWDLETGKTKDSLPPEKNCGTSFMRMSPDGTKILVVEIESVLASNREDQKQTTFVWDLKSGKKILIGDGYLIPHFLPDGNTVLVVKTDYRAKTSVLSRIDLTSGKVLTVRETPEAGLNIQLVDVSPNGKYTAFCLTGKIGMTPVMHVVDTDTLADIDKLTGEADPKAYGYHAGVFSPDGKVFAVCDGKGSIRLWDTTTRKVTRTIAHGVQTWIRNAYSPDGKWLAVAWMPKLDEGQQGSRDPDPLDLPQPRITLYNLTDEKAKPVVLIAPHGYLGGLAFRPDGLQLAFGSAGGVHLFDLSKLK